MRRVGTHPRPRRTGYRVDALRGDRHNALLCCRTSANTGRCSAAAGDPGVHSTSLSELDDLKNRGRTLDVRDAAKAVERIKGLRDRGSLTGGVKVEANMHAVAVDVQPDFAALPSWLDCTVPNDRLLGSVLMLRASQHTSAVVLVTGDINLCKEADFVRVPTIDPPA